MTCPQLASSIDHTLLKAEATPAQVRRLCEEALEYGFASVCVNPRFVRLAAGVLGGASAGAPGRASAGVLSGSRAGALGSATASGSVAVCSVIGFPLGATSTEAKVAEARVALLDGARELDMVMAIGAAKAGEWDVVTADIAAVVEAARAFETSETSRASGADAASAIGSSASTNANGIATGSSNTAKPGTLVKVIIECCLLTDAEKRAACEAAVRGGAAFVKTSTGFSTGGATVEDVRLMRQTVGTTVGVKASGGIKTAEDALRMIEAGATRIGTSNGVAIVGGHSYG
jgi:deoxyribose-phosphate aldolase